MLMQRQPLSTNPHRPWLAALLLCVAVFSLVLQLGNAGSFSGKGSQFESAADFKLLVNHQEKLAQSSKQRDLLADDHEQPFWLALIASISFILAFLSASNPFRIAIPVFSSPPFAISRSRAPPV